LVQVAFVGHAWPQVPQLPASLVSSTHEPPQLVWPLGQVGAHAPLAHCSPVAHRWPQVPQLLGSVISSTQPPLHAVAVPVQSSVQVALAQRSPAEHSCPQCPQLRTSLVVCTHLPEQRVVPARQPQRRLAPLRFAGRQASPAGQQWPAHRTCPCEQCLVSAAHPSAGVITAVPISAAPPARSASRRDSPPLASPRAIASRWLLDATRFKTLVAAETFPPTHS
jgi:hypothetical protein